jgi:hypothetical protein
LSALDQYYELTHKAKSLKRNLKPELKDLAIDAHNVLALRGYVRRTWMSKDPTFHLKSLAKSAITSGSK